MAPPSARCRVGAGASRGCEGAKVGHDAVRRYARRWQRARDAQIAEAYVPLSFAPGEAYQFDWSHEVFVMMGIGFARLANSRADRVTFSTKQRTHHQTPSVFTFHKKARRV